MYVNVAVKNGDEFTSFKLIDDAILVSANAELTTSINLKFSDLCDEVSSEYSYCQGEDSLKETIKIYLYLSTTQDSSSTVTVNEGGLFFDFNISNRLPENSYELSSLDAGDERAFMQIKNGASITQMGDDLLEGRVLSHISSTEQASTTYVASFASPLKIILKSELLDEGEIAVNELVNNTTYNLSLVKINKYYFSSLLSSSKLVTPEDVDVFINKSSCFILSAGFGRDHYVVRYFRAFRDNILMKTELGESFVHLYYSLAPRYVDMIKKSSVLSTVIIALSYFAYFVFNNILIIVFGMGLLTSILFWKGKRYGRA